MVLDNASTDPPSNDDFGDSFPSSDFPIEDGSSYNLTSSDPSRIPIAPGLFVNLTNLPRPVSISPLERQHSSIIVESIKQHVKVIQNVTHRSARQEEIDALAFHTAKGIRLASYGAPVGTLIAWGVATRGHATYRFPFYTPMKEGGRFNPDKFPLLTGMRARIMWHGIRYGLYGFLGSAIGAIFFGSYGLTVSLQGRMTDPRLKDFTDALKKAQRSGRSMSDVLGQGDSAPGPRPRDNETFEMARQRAGVQDAWKMKQQQSHAPQQRVADDASPTGGMFSDEFVDAPADLPDWSRPTASQAGGAPTGGNAWERLRQGAVSSKQDRANSSKGQDGQDGKDGISFLSSEESSQLAKSDDQKQFDERIERERQGRNFEEQGAQLWK